VEEKCSMIEAVGVSFHGNSPKGWQKPLLSLLCQEAFNAITLVVVPGKLVNIVAVE